MTNVIKNVGTVQILQDTSVNEATYVRKGYILFSESTLKNKNLPSETPNVAVGGVYERSNVSRSHVNLNNIGTLLGSFTLENLPDPDPDLVIYNYLTSLIPGMYPNVSGPWSSTENYYNLQSILDYVNNNENVYFCKALGMGLGDISSYKVSDVSRSGLSTLSTNTSPFVDEVGFSTAQNQLKLINYSSILDGIHNPESEVGENFYMRAFNWPIFYGIEVINGSNTFPFFGWGGARIGSIKPETFQFQQNSLYNYPSSFLQLAKSYNPLGIIYAGQGVQCNSFPELGSERKLTFEARNIRTYQETINNRESEIKFTGITPYQQGRGVYEFFTREIIYNLNNGLVDYIEIQGVIPAEGALPGRNNAFLGVALTDYWSNNLNLNNTENGSTTKEDTRMVIPGEQQTKTAHNAPISYISPDANNTYNPLPWNSLWSYIGTTTSSSSNNRADNTPILKDGITSMCISGAYPLYRGSHSSRWTGQFSLFFNNGAYVYDQYYFTEEYWTPGFTDPAIPQISELGQFTPVPPNPPYRIKGGKIILSAGQRVKAGSYVYSTANVVGNVNVSQFYGPSAKDIVLDGGERDQLLGDVYSKYQSNQGSLIVMVSFDGEEPPNPPSCAQPVGVILEDVIGFGEPLYENDNPVDNLLYTSQFRLNISTEENAIISKLTFDPNVTNHIQSREILIKFFPMYPNMSLCDVSTFKFFFFFFAGEFPITISYGNVSNPGVGDEPGFTPSQLRIKSNYLINAGGEFAPLSSFGSEISGFGITKKEQANDWPPIA